MLAALVPAAFDHFTRMRFVLLQRRVGEETDIVVHVEIEERT